MNWHHNESYWSLGKNIREVMLFFEIFRYKKAKNNFLQKNVSSMTNWNINSVIANSKLAL